jgi:hypothetical protein
VGTVVMKNWLPLVLGPAGKEQQAIQRLGNLSSGRSCTYAAVDSSGGAEELAAFDVGACRRQVTCDADISQQGKDLEKEVLGSSRVQVDV